MIDPVISDAALPVTRQDSVLAHRLSHQAYPFLCDVPTRYADLDRLNHINNVAIGFLFEEARLRFHVILGSPLRRSIDRALVMVQANYRFLGETFYPAPVKIGLAVAAIGRTSFSYGMGLFQNDRCTSLCDATLVSLQGRTPSPISDDLREALAAFQQTDGCDEQ